MVLGIQSLHYGDRNSAEVYWIADPTHNRPPGPLLFPMSNDDSTLAGYFRVHDRPPAYEGSDGHPYTVSVETEKTGDLRAPWTGYLVFPRWAQSGVGIVGHVETSDLVKDASQEAVTEVIGRLTLHEIQALLEDAIARSRAATSRSVTHAADDGRTDV
jgi:hypothetical protein